MNSSGKDKTKKRLITFIIFFSIIFFFAIALDVSPYLRGPAPYPPDWRWPYLAGKLTLKMLLPVSIIAYILYLYIKLEQEKNVSKQMSKKWVIFILIISGFLLQMSLLFASRSGITVLIHRIINPHISGYFTAALSIRSLPQFFHDFTQNLADYPMYAKYHPPGGILLFALINVISSTFTMLFPIIDKITPRHTDVALVWLGLHSYEKLGAFISGFVVPLLSWLTLIPLYMTAKLAYDEKTALRSLFFFIFIPSIILFIPLIDAFLPFFTVWATYYFMKGLQTEKKLSMFLSGIFLFLGIFYSLTFLPLLLFFFIVFVLYFLRMKTKKMHVFFQLGCSYVIGTFLIPCLLLVMFQFNLLTMTEIIMKYHEAAQGGRAYTTWLFYNIYDYFLFLGIPLAILFIFMIYRYIKEKTLLHIQQMDILFVAFLVFLMIINITGSVRAETARIWLPFVPLTLLPVVNFLTNNLRLTRKHVLILLLLQAVHVFLFQIFLVPVW